MKAWFSWSRLKHYWQYTKQLSFRRSRILWSCSFSTSFWRKIFSFFSFRELSFSMLKARANALLFCFKDTFNIDELFINLDLILDAKEAFSFAVCNVLSLFLHPLTAPEVKTVDNLAVACLSIIRKRLVGGCTLARVTCKRHIVLLTNLGCIILLWGDYPRFRSRYHVLLTNMKTKRTTFCFYTFCQVTYSDLPLKARVGGRSKKLRHLTV